MWNISVDLPAYGESDILMIAIEYDNLEYSLVPSNEQARSQPRQYVNAEWVERGFEDPYMHTYHVYIRMEVGEFAEFKETVEC